VPQPALSEVRNRLFRSQPGSEEREAAAITREQNILTNEAKRLLKIKEIVLLQIAKANMSMKTKSLFL
jgi:hypothetical protein